MQPMTPPENGSGDGEAPPDGPRYVHVSFTTAGKLFPCVFKGVSPEVGALVLVATERGPELARVAIGARGGALAESGDVLELIRVATPEDLTQADRNVEREQLATRACLTLIEAQKIAMKLVHVQYLLGGQKAIFYFTAEGRVDFRALVKDLSRDLRIRVEMRQIGVRDETKMVGGIGHCGLSLCCSTWLRDFVPVSIRMAKDQNLALNPQKVSGACGRLLCCLAYEHETYVDARKELPKVGRRLNTTAGPGRVLSLEVLKERFVVELETGERLLLGPGDILTGPAPGPVFSSRKGEREESAPSEEGAAASPTDASEAPEGPLKDASEAPEAPPEPDPEQGA